MLTDYIFSSLLVLEIQNSILFLHIGDLTTHVGNILDIRWLVLHIQSFKSFFQLI